MLTECQLISFQVWSPSVSLTTCFYISGFGTGRAETGLGFLRSCAVWDSSDLKGKISVIRNHGSVQRLLNPEWVNSPVGEERAESGLLMPRLSSPLTSLTAEGSLNSALTPCHLDTEHYFHFVFSFPSCCSTGDASYFAWLEDRNPFGLGKLWLWQVIKIRRHPSIKTESLCVPTFELFWNKMMQSRTTLTARLANCTLIHPMKSGIHACSGHKFQTTLDTYNLDVSQTYARKDLVNWCRPLKKGKKS